MQKVNFIITSDLSNNLKKTKLIDLHDNYLFGHSYDINGNLNYWNQEENYNNIFSG